MERLSARKRLFIRVLSLFFIFTLLSTSFSPLMSFSNITTVKAEEEQEDNFYTSDRDILEDLFQLTLKDAYGNLKHPIGWVTSGRTFVVVREYLDADENTRYKVYVNVPNLAQYIRNLAIKSNSDGWEDKMYIPESKLVEDVGKKDNNVVNKFGFNIPVNKYKGEYPIISMSLSGILPTSWIKTIWRGLKALLGLSFTNAPNKENFKTLFYYNHQYVNSGDEQLIAFIQDYWLDYFVGALWSDEEQYFRDAEDFRAQLITEDQINEAEQFLEDNKDKIKELRKEEDETNEYIDKYNKDWVKNNTKYNTDVEEYNKYLENQAKKLGYSSTKQLQDDIVNNSGKYKSLSKEQKKKLKSPEWEDYRPKRDADTKSDEEAEKDAEVLRKAAEYEQIKTNFDNFKEKWNRGKKKNDVLYGSGFKIDPSGTTVDDGYKFSYAQCFLDISEKDIEENDGENNCSKMVDGQLIAASVVEVFVNTGLYKIGLTEESKKSVADGGSGKLGNPVEKEIGFGKNITSYFGNRTPPTGGASGNHGGIDIAWGGCGGSPAMASTGGTVELAGTNGGYGNCVIIDHGGGIKTLYGHLRSISVSKGDSVTPRQEIGKIGTTGTSTGDHLHFEVHMNGKRVDPLTYLDTSVSGMGGSEPLKYKESLSRREAIKILKTLQSKLGPAYQEVMENIMTCMMNNAKAEGEEIEIEEFVDVRVMPYDRNTLVEQAGGGTSTETAKDIVIDDPRVEIYKHENLIGGFVSTGEAYFDSIVYSNGLAKLFIILSGKLAALSVFCNQITNFTVLENVGLSPTTMWKAAPSTIVTTIILILMIFNIVVCAFRYIKGRSSIGQILGRVGIFLFLVALVTLFSVYPQKTWDNFKSFFNAVNNAGELAITSNMKNVDELYGDGKDASVTYYLPYFNLWTKYHTGYNINDPQQVIKDSDPEAEDMHGPKINGKETTLWPVVLADSFNRNGYNRSSMEADSRNGPAINPNAYRVVDHFIAPRLTSSKPEDEKNLNLHNTDNENNNGKFQKLDVFSGISCILASINLLLIAVIKMLTFLWIWYLLYIILFEIMLGATGKHKEGIKTVLVKTFSPILMMAIIGLYSGIVVEMSILAEGIIGTAINGVFIWLTFKLLAVWRQEMPNSFPPPLKFLAAIGAIRQSRIYRQTRALHDNMGHNLKRAGVNKNEDGTYDAKFIDSEGNYIGNSDYEEAAYNDIMKEAQLQAQSDYGYENIKDERIKRRLEQLDKNQKKDVGKADASAKYTSDGGLSNRVKVNANNMPGDSKISQSNGISYRPAPNGSKYNSYSSKPVKSTRGQGKPNKSRKKVGQSKKIGEEYAKK